MDHNQPIVHSLENLFHLKRLCRLHLVCEMSGSIGTAISQRNFSFWFLKSFFKKDDINISTSMFGKLFLFA